MYSNQPTVLGTLTDPRALSLIPAPDALTPSNRSWTFGMTSKIVRRLEKIPHQYEYDETRFYLLTTEGCLTIIIVIRSTTLFPYIHMHGSDTQIYDTRTVPCVFKARMSADTKFAVMRGTPQACRYHVKTWYSGGGVLGGKLFPRVCDSY